MEVNQAHDTGTTEYQIEILGRLEAGWLEWFNGLAIESGACDQGPTVTTLTVRVADQAKLRGILARIWDLNLTVLNVQRMDMGS
jgi:hypothetical protein